MGIKGLGIISSPISNSTQSNSWVDYVSNGGLMKPIPEFLDIIRRLENAFNFYHGEKELKKHKNVNKLLFEKMKQEAANLDPRIMGLFIRTRTYIRIRKLNSELQTKTLQLKSKKSLYKTVL
uniref:Uncharacterized protein n=1 Tax=Cacopsylla melanoneura TaxID=428564 RepID=A0A8D9BUN7_9HEMI